MTRIGTRIDIPTAPQNFRLLSDLTITSAMGAVGRVDFTGLSGTGAVYLLLAGWRRPWTTGYVSYIYLYVNDITSGYSQKSVTISSTNSLGVSTGSDSSIELIDSAGDYIWTVIYIWREGYSGQMMAIMHVYRAAYPFRHGYIYGPTVSDINKISLVSSQSDTFQPGSRFILYRMGA